MFNVIGRYVWQGLLWAKKICIMELVYLIEISHDLGFGSNRDEVVAYMVRSVQAENDRETTWTMALAWNWTLLLYSIMITCLLAASIYIVIRVESLYVNISFHRNKISYLLLKVSFIYFLSYTLNALNRNNLKVYLIKIITS